MKLEYLQSGSADCPLVRLYAFDAREATKLCEQLSQLASEPVDEIALHEQPYVQAVDGCQLVLRLARADQGIIEVSSPGSLECVLTGEGWQDVLERASPLIDAPSGHFQWLDQTSDISLLLSKSGEW